MVVEAVGVRPRLDWLAGSGIDVDPVGGGILVDESARTTLAGAVAVGDGAARWSPRAGCSGAHRALGNDALRAPTVAAASPLGTPAVYDPVPYVSVRQIGATRTVAASISAVVVVVAAGNAGPRLGSTSRRAHRPLTVDRGRRTLTQARRLIDAGRVVDPDRLADPDVPICAL